jgi:hypothetical protein
VETPRRIQAKTRRDDEEVRFRAKTLRHLVTGIALIITACDETARFRFDTAQDAHRDPVGCHLSPADLPDSAFDIIEEQDLDTNCGQGRFRFIETDADKLKTQLQPLTAGVQNWCFVLCRADYEQQGFEFFRSGKFSFAINWTTCEAHFWFDARA